MIEIKTHCKGTATYYAYLFINKHSTLTPKPNQRDRSYFSKEQCKLDMDL